MACKSSLAMVFLLVISCASISTATDYTVGDSSGWTLGVDYSTWVSGKSFQVGDTLTFNYAASSHTVEEVSSSDYSSCSTSNPISNDNSGKTTITLNTASTRYYICGITGHCAGGMKLAVTVAAAASAPNSPSTPASPTTPSITPTSTAPTATPPSSTPTNSGSAFGSVRELAIIGLGGFVGYVLGVF